MTASMLTVLALCGTWFTLRGRDPEGWRGTVWFILEAAGVYITLWFSLAVLYVEVVLRWLVF